MTSREKQLLNYLHHNEGLTYDELSVFDSPRYGHLNRKCMESLILTGKMKRRSPGSEFIEITLKGIEALEEYELQMEKRNLDKKSYRISVAAIIISILSLVFAILSKFIF